MEDNVIWRDVVSFNGVFKESHQVSNFGIVRTKDRCITYKRNGIDINMLWHSNILKQCKDRDGYCLVVLQWNSHRKTAKVHQLVADAFPEICGEKFTGAQVDHRDCNKENNIPENLWYCTQKENSNNPITKIHISEKASKRQINRKDMSKPVLQFKKDGTLVAEYPSCAEAQRQTGIPNAHISACCSNKPHYNTAGGYKWIYKSDYGKMNQEAA